MCGIHGFSFHDNTLLRDMVRRSHHRGPDGTGYFEDGQVSLGHNLLYITDTPESSRQPWVIEEGRFVLVYNGEIYNYRRLRAELEREGERFQTDCDTEVLAAGLMRHGAEFVRRLDGMFAFAWYDREARTLALARDPTGTKPLYYHAGSGRLVFSSELRSLLSAGMERRLDPFSLGLYFQLGYVPGPRTMIQGVNKVVPGEIIVYDLARQEVARRACYRPQLETPRQKYKAHEFRAAVREAVEQSSMGLRSMGLYLSGGLDSSIILHELCELGHKPITLSTRFEADGAAHVNDDATLAEMLAKQYGTRHIDLRIKEKDYIKAIEPACRAMEEPRYNRNSPAYYIACKAMADTGAIITMSGDGGDEVLTGYNHHMRVKSLSADLLRKPRRFTALQRLRDMLFARPQENMEVALRVWVELMRFKAFPASAARQADIVTYAQEWLPFDGMPHDPIYNELLIEQVMWLPEDALIRNDKLGMWFGMEARFPLLTRSFQEYAMGIASERKMHPDVTKWLTRSAYHTILPKQVLKKRKAGWSTPSELWMGKGGLGGVMREINSPEYYAPLFDLEIVREAAGMDFIKMRFALMNLQVWARHFGISV